MRTLGMAALGGVAYLAFLAVGAPATLVAGPVRDATNGMVQLTNTRGTLWNGSARALVTPRQAAPFEIEKLSWSWRPARLVAGEVAFGTSLASPGLEATLDAARGFSGWALRELQVRAEARRIADWIPFARTWQPAGALTANAPQLAWDGKAFTGDATLEWRGATTALSTVNPVGSYRAELKATGGPARLAVTTLDGPLRITGQGTLALPGRATFTGEASTTAEHAKALEALLGLLGPRRADGAHAIDWRAP